MIRDTFDMFKDPDADRGRFGEAQCRPSPRRKVTGKSNLVDLDMVHHTDRDTDKAVFVSFGHRKAAKFLPKSQIEMVATGQVQRRFYGQFDQPVRVTMPEWLAKDKELI